MNLKKASLFFLVGLSYHILHNAIFAAFPLLANNNLIGIILKYLWLLATSTFILFVYYFLKEVTPLNQQIKISLKLIIIFISIMILTSLPIEVFGTTRIIRNVIFQVSRELNSISLLVFWVYLNKTISDKYSLRQSIRLLIYISVIDVIIGLMHIYYGLNFIITGHEVMAFPPIKFLSIILFILKYLSVIFFLIKFRKIDDYSKSIKKV